MADNSGSSDGGYRGIWLRAILSAIPAVIGFGATGWIELVDDQPLLEYRLTTEPITMPTRPLAKGATVELDNLAAEPPSAHVVVILRMADPNAGDLRFFSEDPYKTKIIPVFPASGDGYAEPLGIEIDFHLTNLAPQDQLQLVGYYEGTTDPAIQCRRPVTTGLDTAATPRCIEPGLETWTARNRKWIFPVAIGWAIVAAICVAVATLSGRGVTDKTNANTLEKSKLPGAATVPTAATLPDASTTPASTPGQTAESTAAAVEKKRDGNSSGATGAPGAGSDGRSSGSHA